MASTAAGVGLVVAIVLGSLAAAPASAGGPQFASAICGKADYPSASVFGAAGVVNASLWDALRSRGGFANGTEGQGAVEVRVPDGGVTHVVRLAEILVRQYVGGAAQDVPMVALQVRDESGAQVSAVYNFTWIGPGHGGGNLTLVAWLSGGALEIFWRWAYLPCDEAFPNLYYVFHARVSGGGVADDNSLVYFEAPRPKRGPPLDLIVLVVAGLAASGFFLYGRRALRRRGPPTSRSQDRTP